MILLPTSSSTCKLLTFSDDIMISLKEEIERGKAPTHFHIVVVSTVIKDNKDCTNVSFEIARDYQSSVEIYKEKISTFKKEKDLEIVFSGDYITAFSGGDFIHRRPCSKRHSLK